MGQTLLNLARRKLKRKAIFNNRFVVEVCEKVHIHYRNLRLNLELDDWIKLSEGLKSSLTRWQKMGQPPCDKNNHIELVRKNVAGDGLSDEVLVNLNRNLYKANKGRIFSEGADFDDDKYIHLKIRDYRIELSLDEFGVLTDAIKEAEERLESRGSDTDVRSS